MLVFSEKHGNAPYSGKCHKRINDSAHDCSLPAEHPRNYIKLKEPDASPVYRADYYKNQFGEYEAHLLAKDRNTELVTIKMTVPSEKMAAAICDNWQEKNQEIYQFLTEHLF